MKQIDEEQVRDWEIIAGFLLVMGYIISKLWR